VVDWPSSEISLGANWVRLLLDAKDLIALFVQGEHVSQPQFKEWLEARGGSLVLTGTNVSQAVVLLLEAEKSAELRGMLGAIAALPVCYLKEIAVFVEELGRALVAFGRDREPLSIDPYVAKWTDTLGVSLGKSYASQGIFESVTHLWRTAPEALLHFHRYQEILSEEQVVGKAVTPSSPTLEAGPNRESHFARHLERQLKLHGFTLPLSKTTAFADWVYANPRRCPGLRLAYEVGRELAAAERTVAPDTGLHGLGHLNAIPYVERATLGDQLYRHCRSVSGQLRSAHPDADYSGRLFPNLISALATN
jgi:hypothetical protein